MEWRGLNVLITGGAGHIGSHLAARLFALGASVFVADNLWRGRMSNLYLDSRPVIDLDRKFFKLDLVDYSNCIAATRNMDTVYHLADV